MDPLEPIFIKEERDSEENGHDYPLEVVQDVCAVEVDQKSYQSQTHSGERSFSLSSFEIDTDQFINEMENRPAIWDSRTKEYGNKISKTKAWEELCELFVPDYYEMDNAKKKIAVVELQKRWRSLRCSFSRESRKHRNRTGKTGKEYVYFQQLSFLLPVCEHKSQQDGISEGQTEERNQGIAEEINQDDPDDLEDETYLPCRHPSPLTKKRKATSTVTEERLLFKTLAKNIERRTSEKKVIDDPDKCYLLSLLPHYKSLTEDAKLEFQMDVLKALKKYKNFGVFANHQFPPTQNQHFHGPTSSSWNSSSTETQQTVHPSIHHSYTNSQPSGSTGSPVVTQLQPATIDSASSESAAASRGISPLSNSSSICDELFPV